jgi:ribosomal-protein-alanine N-acetyltransferase
MTEATHVLFPVLTTSRLVLRKLEDEDLQAIFALRSDATVCRYIDRDRQQHTGEAKAFIENIKKGYSDNNTYYWALGLKDNPALIGCICFWNFSKNNTVAETGYEMLPEHYGKGYMQEALEAISQYGFHVLKLAAIEAYTHRDNTSSKNLLERNGFVLCESKVDGNVDTNVVYKKERIVTT